MPRASNIVFNTDQPFCHISKKFLTAIVTPASTEPIPVIALIIGDINPKAPSPAVWVVKTSFQDIWPFIAWPINVGNPLNNAEAAPANAE